MYILTMLGALEVVPSYFFLLPERTLLERCCVHNRHSSRVVAFLQAVAKPKFRGPRSASIARCQLWLGLPAGRFRSGSTCRIHAARARWWSSWGELRAIWPKSRRRLLVTRWDSGEQPVVLLTSAFDTCMSDRGVTWFPAWCLISWL